MSRRIDRRSFLNTAGTALAAIGVAKCTEPARAAGQMNKLSTPNAAKLGWDVALPTYTFRSGPFYDAVPKIAELGVQHVEPAFFLRLDAKRPDLQTNEKLTPKLRKEMKQRMDDFGIHMTTFYAELTADEEAAKRVMEFSKEMGVATIVAEPPPAAFDALEKLCDEFEINLAVHNHPQAPNYTYWDPINVLKVCEGRGKRIGACCDTGHWIRSNLPVIPCLKKMQGRIISLHLKDVAVWDKPEARDVPLGEGLAKYAEVLAELQRQEFKGVMTVEYEHESDKLMDELRQCLSFVEANAGRLIQ